MTTLVFSIPLFSETPMRSMFVYIVLFTSVLVYSSPLPGQQFSDEQAWLTAVDCQSSVTEDFDGIPIVGVSQLYSTPSSPLTVAFGEITTPIIDNDGEDILILRNDGVEPNFFNSQALVLISQVVKYDLIPASTTGAVGFTFVGDMKVQMFDGNNLIFETDLTAEDLEFFGWIDTTATTDRVVLNLNGASAFVSEVTFGIDCVASNEAPTADAGANQRIFGVATVALDGSASFDDNTAQTLLVYNWSFVSTPTGSAAVLDDPTSVTPSFLADLSGTYLVELVVTDQDGLSDAAQVQISSDNQAPTGVATPNGAVAVVGDVVQFDGSGSTDPEMDPISYQWNILAAPAGSTAALVGANTVNPTLTPDVEGFYSVTLVASDFLGPGIPVQAEFTAAATTEIVIVDASDLITALPLGEVTTKGNQNALLKHLANAVQDLQDGEIADAIDKLNKAISRTDGCPLRGSPDGNGPGRDWITDCAVQQEIYELLTAAVESLIE